MRRIAGAVAALVLVVAFARCSQRLPSAAVDLGPDLPGRAAVVFPNARAAARWCGDEIVVATGTAFGCARDLQRNAFTPR